ncbi:MAG TPA: 3-phosphoshikimate 1-carboxyvinyltransferase [Gemmatimonadaceae bacterium]|nr:3-phosphoshikimate 1-carboxyvinyltransferase [Gemmatimonadaceae bacterium]
MAALNVRGTVRVPGDKSISHRALMLGALAEGESSVRGILDSADVRSTRSVLNALGADIPELGSVTTFAGGGLKGLRASGRALDCGNSGTTARLAAGLVAGNDFTSRFVGDDSLSRRPMKRVAEPLTYMGARFEFDRADGLPMTVHGADLRSIDWETGNSSAQVKSAILLAGLTSGLEVRVTEKRRSRDHTERMLRAMGVDVENDGNQVCLRPARRLVRLDMDIPADPSSAAYFAALCTVAQNGLLDLPEVCLNPTRSGFVEALSRMGGDIEVVSASFSGEESTGTLRVRSAELTDIEITEEEVPSLIDELPLLACVAAAAGVELVIGGAGELRAKESDRIATVVSNLRAVGAQAEERPDGLRVWGGRRTLAGSVNPRGDHRIAMAFGILGAATGNRISVESRECVAVSYPAFWTDLERVAA